MAGCYFFRRCLRLTVLSSSGWLAFLQTHRDSLHLLGQLGKRFRAVRKLQLILLEELLKELEEELIERRNDHLNAFNLISFNFLDQEESSADVCQVEFPLIWNL